jgi:predicted dinucleotide-binding enzyme
MDSGIIGAGNIGATLARRLTALGYHISVANSRGPQTLAALAAETGATAGSSHEAARGQDISHRDDPGEKHYGFTAARRSH